MTPPRRLTAADVVARAPSSDRTCRPTPLRRSFALLPARRLAEAGVLAADGLLQGARRAPQRGHPRTRTSGGAGSWPRRRGTTPSGSPSRRQAIGGVRATVFVPETAPRAKVDKLRTFAVDGGGRRPHLRRRARAGDGARRAARRDLRPRLRRPAHRRRPGHGGAGDRGRPALGGHGGGAGGRRRPDLRGSRWRSRRASPTCASSPCSPTPRPRSATRSRAGRAAPRVRRRAHAGRRPRGRHRGDRLGAPRPDRRRGDGERGGDRGRHRRPRRARPGDRRGRRPPTGVAAVRRGPGRRTTAGRSRSWSPAATSTSPTLARLLARA